MSKTLADVEKKIDILDETEVVQTGRGWKFWVITPVVLAALGSGAFLVVRRWLGNSEN